MNEMQRELNEYYENIGITPVPVGTLNNMFGNFCCSKKWDCRNACQQASQNAGFRFFPRTEGVTVSQYYKERKYKGHCIPRIVVVSLSAPMLNLSSTTGSNTLKPHWRGTTTTVRSLLHPFIELDPAGNARDQSTNIIEQLFVHLRTAKCCSNAGGSRPEPDQVYENCGPYLSKEVSILKPDVIVTQGDKAHYQSEKHIFDKNAKKTAVQSVQGIANSIARIVNLKEGNWSVYWLRSHFPYGRFYSSRHAGPKIDPEVGAKLKNLVRYGKKIKKFMEVNRNF